MYRLQINEGFRIHVVPNDLVGTVTAELQSRGARVEKQDPVSEAHWDFGGMLMVGMPEERFDLPGGVTMTMFADQIEGGVVALNGYRAEGPRNFQGVPYYKLHGWHCIVLHPSQFEVLHAQMRARIPETDKKLDAFYASRRAQGLPTSTPAFILAGKP